jgi:N-acetylglucosaminyl-diphospho-decaprenol L-rhamnosyltransferase
MANLGKRIVFSIVSHGQRALVDKLLISLDNNLVVGDFDIILVITQNIDEPNCDFISSLYPVKVIENLRPRGFGSNHNHVFEMFSSDYIFILNPDIEFNKPFCLARFVDSMVSKNLKLCSPKIMSPDLVTEDFLRVIPTPVSLIKRRLKFNGDVEHFDWIAGMFLVVESSVFRNVGGFDEGYFMYVEDCDLSIRVNNEFSIGVLSTFSVIHDARRGSLKSWRHFFWHVKSLLLLYCKLLCRRL